MEERRIGQGDKDLVLVEQGERFSSDPDHCGLGAVRGVSMTTRRNSEDSPITTGQVIKWGGLAGAVITVVISLVWFVANMQRQITALQVDDVNFRAQQAIDDARRDKRLDNTEHQNDDLKRSISDLKTELEVAVTILHRLDERMPEKRIDQ